MSISEPVLPCINRVKTLSREQPQSKASILSVSITLATYVIFKFSSVKALSRMSDISLGPASKSVRQSVASFLGPDPYVPMIIRDDRSTLLVNDP